MSPTFSSRFSDFNRRQAILTLLVVAAGLSYVFFVGFAYPDCTPPLEYPPEVLEDPLFRDDSHLYRRIIQRVHDGGKYYDAANIELRQHGFKPDSVFNWRLPTYAWVIGALPSPFYAQIILVLLALTALFLVYMNEQKDLPVSAAVVTVVLTYGVFHSFMAPPIADLDTVPAVLFQETWACVLITISVAAYGLGWRVIGVVAGLSALFWRELALPYCVIAAFLALWRGQRKETMMWGAGLLLFAWFFSLHCSEISRRLDGTPGGVSNVSRWLGLLGIRFHFFALNVNVWLAKFSGWGMATYLSLSVIGLAGWKRRQSAVVGLTVAAYLVTFCFVGQGVNCYWGLLYATLLPYGVVRGPVALWQLIQSAFHHESGGLNIKSQAAK